MTELRVSTTPIPGLLVVDLPLAGDHRGWFKENWQRAKMTALGLPDFGPVQHNVSHNARAGTTRGFHAEPWDKFVSVISGRIHGAWVDLREGPTFGTSYSCEVGVDRAVLVPRGVANAFQTLVDDTTYSYLVNEHWSAEARADYTFCNLADETVAMQWPLGLDPALMSEADRSHPRLGAVVPVPARQVLVTGANGQLGRAFAGLPGVRGVDRAQLDLSDAAAVAAFDWRGVDTVIHTAAFTRVDDAEIDPAAAWAGNVGAVANLVQACRTHRLRLVHFSSDYVFDGRLEVHSEDESPSPLNVYGHTKAAADTLVATLPEHLVVRTGWLVGDGPNFVRTMAERARRGEASRVVDDQVGRLTFVDDLVAGVHHLLAVGATGTVNLTNSGASASWAEIAAEVYRLCDSSSTVTPISSEEYATGRAVARRPRHSTLDLGRLEATGFSSPTWQERLADYVAGASKSAASSASAATQAGPSRT